MYLCRLLLIESVCTFRPKDHFPWLTKEVNKKRKEIEFHFFLSQNSREPAICDTKFNISLCNIAEHVSYVSTDFLYPEAAKFVIPHGSLCFFPPYLLLKKIFVPVTSAAVWKSACLCHCVCVYVPVCFLYVCTPLWGRQSVFVLSESRKLCHPAAQWPRHYGIEKENTREREQRWCFCVVSCWSSFIRPDSELEIHHNRLNPSLHENGFSSKAQSNSLFCLSVCVFVVLSGFPFAPFSISNVCGEWNDLSAAATFRPGWAHTVKNKMCSHDLIPKPVTTGSNHRFITTPKRERGEEEGGEKRGVATIKDGEGEKRDRHRRMKRQEGNWNKMGQREKKRDDSKEGTGEDEKVSEK